LISVPAAFPRRTITEASFTHFGKGKNTAMRKVGQNIHSVLNHPAKAGQTPSKSLESDQLFLTTLSNIRLSPIPFPRLRQLLSLFSHLLTQPGYRQDLDNSLPDVARKP